MLQRAREERAETTCGGACFEPPTLGAEPDHDEPRVEPGERVKRTSTPFCSMSLPKYTTVGGPSPARNVSSRAAFPSSGWRSSPLPGFGASRRASCTSASSAAPRSSGVHSSTSTPGGTSCTRSTLPQTSSSTVRMCSEPTNVRGGQLERLAPPALELRVTPHRVLELRAVRLDGVPRPGGRADGPAEQHMVRKDEVGREQRAHGGCVRIDPGVQLLTGAILDATHLVALVAVEDEDRQEAGDVRADRGRAAEVVCLGAGLLAEHRYVVPLAAPLAGELARVDVRARSAEEVSVPEQDAHGRHPAGPPGSRRGNPLRAPAPACRSCAGRRSSPRPGRGRPPTAPGRSARRHSSGRQATRSCRSARASQSSWSVSPFRHDAVRAPSGASWRSSRRTTTGRPGPSSPGRSPA